MALLIQLGKAYALHYLPEEEESACLAQLVGWRPREDDSPEARRLNGCVSAATAVLTLLAAEKPSLEVVCAVLREALRVAGGPVEGQN